MGAGLLVYRDDGSLQFSSDWPVYHRIASGSAGTVAGYGGASVLNVPVSSLRDIVTIRIPDGLIVARWYTDAAHGLQKFFTSAGAGTTLSYDIHRLAQDMTPGTTGNVGLECYDANGALTFTSALAPMIMAGVITAGSSLSFSGAASILLNNYSGYLDTMVDYQPLEKEISGGGGIIQQPQWLVTTDSYFRGIKNTAGTYSVADLYIGTNSSTTNTNPGGGGISNDVPYGMSFLIKRYT